MVLALGYGSSAQENSATNATSLLDPWGAKHIVKTNLVGYAFYSITTNYEYKTGNATSVGLLGGYKLPQTITVNALVDAIEGPQKYTGEIDPEGYFINPYFRFYAQQSMKGFYFEGFLRYYDFKYLVPYDYEKNGGTIRANADGEASAFGGGLGIGSQFSLGGRWFLDVNLGFGLARGDIHIETNDPNLDEQDYADIAQAIEDNKDSEVEIFLLGDILNEIEAGASSTQAWADINDVILPIVRGGVSVGFGF